ncbi:MAG: zf-HC2 domain-containing protein [Acidobacteriota bacterium]|nr:zf-HC2 domain-containing protein [Acidobacteriota bacterium]
MTQDLETLLAELIEASPGGQPPHPEPALLLRYWDQELDPEEAAAVREHLVACRACTAALVDLEALEELKGPASDSEEPADYSTADHATADYATAAAWRDLRARLAEEEDSSEAPAAASAPSPSRNRPPADGRARAWIPRLAAVLAAAVVGLGIWVAQLSEQEQTLEDQVADLSAPQANPAVLYLDALTRNEDATPPTLPASRRAMVFLTPPVEPAASSYRVEIHDAEGTPWLTLDDLELQELGALRLSFIPQPPSLGEHRLRLYAKGEEEPLATYPLLLIAPPEHSPEP